MKNFFKNITSSPHAIPILDILLIWVTALCSIVNFSTEKTELGICWAICALLDSITMYLHLYGE
jgi:hypothetical protein